MEGVKIQGQGRGRGGKAEKKASISDTFTKGHWQKDEVLKYQLFLYHNVEKFIADDVRRSLRMFKQMSLFIQTRSPGQCRTHHQKLCQKFGSIQHIFLHYLANNADFQVEYRKARRDLIDHQEMGFIGISPNNERRKKNTQTTANQGVEHRVHPVQVKKEEEERGSARQGEPLCQVYPSQTFPPIMAMLGCPQMGYPFVFHPQVFPCTPHYAYKP